jgi:hypothetical protein
MILQIPAGRVRFHPARVTDQHPWLALVERGESAQAAPVHRRLTCRHV